VGEQKGGGAQPPQQVPSLWCDWPVYMQVLREQYPERLCEVWMYNAPLFFSALWKGIAPFISPGTRGKIRFVRGKDGQQELLSRFGPEVRGTKRHRPVLFYGVDCYMPAS
jgi:hypothetical protein